MTGLIAQFQLGHFALFGTGTQTHSTLAVQKTQTR
jgi:hypothetical protein